jgi:hypothetical protein
MKQFKNYQYVFGEMSDRDKQEQGSKFWNQGKFENFVLPFLPDDVSEMTFIDMGCNHGIFLKMAEDMGFKTVVGVDSDKRVIQKAEEWKKMSGGKYRLIRGLLQHALPELPIADYTVLANAHYYVPINNWLDYVRELKNKTRYVIIVTAQKKERKPYCKGSPHLEDIREYFEDWEEVGFVEPSLEGDPFPRRLYGLCFRNPLLERIPLDELNCGNKVQKGFYQDTDNGINIEDTSYYKIYSKYQLQKRSKRRVDKHLLDIQAVYEDVKKNGIKTPIIAKKSLNNRIIDGNHRHEMLKHLGYKSAIVRRVR